MSYRLSWRWVAVTSLCLAPQAVFSQDTTRPIREVQLNNVTVRSPYAKLRRDSAERRILYRKDFYEATFKPKMVMILPPTVSGLFTKLALVLSGKQKRAKHFKAVIERDEAERFVSIRYNPAVVARVTGLPDSAAQQFIAANPIPREVVAAAGELELLQWIRDRQRGKGQ